MKNLRRDTSGKIFDLQSTFLFLSCALALFILSASWIFHQFFSKDIKKQPHIHAETIEKNDKKLPELSSKDLKKINNYDGLIFQNRKDQKEIIKEEKELSEKIREEEEEKKTAIAKTKKFTTTVKKSAPKRVGRPARILADTKNTPLGKVCEHDDDGPKRSPRNEKWHIDTECCLDPDEIPNSNCYYPPEIYGKMIERYLNRK